MRVVFLGNDEVSVPSLEAVAGSGHEVALVVTRVPRPAGRGGDLRPTPVAEEARDFGLMLEEVETVKRGPGLEAIRTRDPDVLAVVAYGEILPAEVLRLPRRAPVNLHFSLLPALRGADPVRRALIDGLQVTGVTTIRMDEGMDTGPILLQSKERIRAEDDAWTLSRRLAAAGAELLVKTLDALDHGDLVERPQDEERATLAPKLRPEEEWIDWSAEAAVVARRVRALAPDPAARTTFRGKLLKVLRAGVADGSGRPGTIVTASKRGVLVAAGSGALSLEEVLPEGRKRMSGPEFVRGYHPEVGEALAGRGG